MHNEGCQSANDLHYPKALNKKKSYFNVLSLLHEHYYCWFCAKDIQSEEGRQDFSSNNVLISKNYQINTSPKNHEFTISVRDMLQCLWMAKSFR